MKKILKISFLLVFLFTIKIYSQNSINEAEVKLTLTKLFDFSKNRNYKQAANFLAYTGKDKNRIERTSFNFSEKSEIKAVKRKCKNIKAYLELSDSYEYGKFTRNGNKAVLNVIFKSGDQELKIAFSFVKIGNKILLIDFQ